VNYATPTRIFILAMAFGATAGMDSSGDTSSHVAVPVDSSYKLVFDDEFNGTAIDTDKWNILSSNTMGGGYGKDLVTPDNASESGGFLTLLATQGPASDRPYRVAFLFTKQSWAYGYWEGRAKMPANGHGLWPAFWMNHGGTYPEIDILEWLGNNPKEQWTTYHPVDDAKSTNGVGFGTTVTGPDYSAAFHVYGMWWQPTSITWYIDGVQVFQITQGQKFKGTTIDITSTAMETILNSAVGGWNKNVVDSSTVFPTGYLVDYVHIYSNNPNVSAVIPQPGYGGPGDSVGSGDGK